MTTPHDPTRGMHRADGHDTSRQAAAAVLGKRTALQRVVLAKFLEAGANGLTLYELEQLCNDHRSTMRTRCAELVQQRLLIDSGTKRLVNGRMRKVWRIRTPADDAGGDLVDLMHGGRTDPLEALLGRGFCTEFQDAADLDRYLRANHFRLAGQDGGATVYKTVKGHRLAVEPAGTTIVGRLSWEAPQANRDFAEEALGEPRLTADSPPAGTH